MVQSHIVGIGIAHSSSKVYVWFNDGTVRKGSSERLDKSFSIYSLPDEKKPEEIVDIAIAADDHCYAWYKDGTVSAGTSVNLGKYRKPYPYSLPMGKTPSDISAIGIASDDHCYAWYKDGTVSAGTSDNLGKYRTPYSYSLPKFKNPSNIVSMGIAPDDHCYAWYSDGTVSAGTSNDLDKYRLPYNYNYIFNFISNNLQLNFAMQHQQQTNWCWAAVTVSVSAFFKPTTSWTQCTLVNAEFARNDCCTSGSISACNKPWYLQKSLKRTNNLESWSSGTGTMSKIAFEINNGNPICVRIGWSGGGGHAVAIDGYDIDLNIVKIDDPWYGASDVTLDTFKNAYYGTGKWTHKYFVKP